SGTGPVADSVRSRTPGWRPRRHIANSGRRAMRIRYVRGDLLKTPARFILHGCNAQGVMGAGVAAAIRDRYPAAYAAYRKRFETVGLRVGDTIWVACGDRVIINAITQERYGRSGVFVDYDAIA